LYVAEEREERAKEARLAHKEAADAQEECARDLAAAGDVEGAARAREHADQARERENQT
jgi:hypothetical protein